MRAVRHRLDKIAGRFFEVELVAAIFGPVLHKGPVLHELIVAGHFAFEHWS